jgi:hypothetical protein
MNDIEQKALALLNEVAGERISHIVLASHYDLQLTLCRAIEQHEAFKQKVSDAVDAYLRINSFDNRERLGRFIIPKPDPLVEVLKDTHGASLIDADELRAALEARGLEIRSKANGD